ncbi:SDR family oxidoreductase [Mesorhizobium sp. UC74_2]|uniref:SDR family oxidoreductase n=1 Tax=Mesorhizobium sp. UC74_2 TaxID=3350171 RepID=UPI003672A98C
MQAGEDKPVVIVTGGGSGIGAAVAERLANSHRVVICGRRRNALDAIAARTGADAVALDVTDHAAAREMVTHTVERHGRLDGLVLNAGIILSASIAELPIADWDRQIAVNLTAPFVMTQARAATSPGQSRCRGCGELGGRSANRPRHLGLLGRQSWNQSVHQMSRL